MLPLPTAAPPTEVEEWVAYRLETWVETYKKSMLTPILLAHVSRAAEAGEPCTAATLASSIANHTGWQLTERGLYRTIKRLAGEGLLDTAEVTVPRTGAKRKALTLTPVGRTYLDAIRHLIVPLG